MILIGLVDQVRECAIEGGNLLYLPRTGEGVAVEKFWCRSLINDWSVATTCANEACEAGLAAVKTLEWCLEPSKKRMVRRRRLLQAIE